MAGFAVESGWRQDPPHFEVMQAEQNKNKVLVRWEQEAPFEVKLTARPAPQVAATPVAPQQLLAETGQPPTPQVNVQSNS